MTEEQMIELIKDQQKTIRDLSNALVQATTKPIIIPPTSPFEYEITCDGTGKNKL